MLHFPLISPALLMPELSAWIVWLLLISFMKLRLEGGVFAPFPMVIESLTPALKQLHPCSCMMLEGEGSSWTL